MAGSYNHSIDETTGKLYRPEDFVRMVENLGDAYETVKEMYGMIWHLAADLEQASGGTRKAAGNVEWAHDHYQDGITASPGTDGEIADDDDE